MNKETRQWLIEDLESWRETWRDEESEEANKAWNELSKLIGDIKKRNKLTVEQFEEIIFYLYQHHFEGE